MTTSESDRNLRQGEEDGSQTPEERLGEAVAKTSEQAPDKNEHEVETDLRSAMVDRGLEPGDTSDMAAIIANGTDTSSETW